MSISKISAEQEAKLVAFRIANISRVKVVIVDRPVTRRTFIKSSVIEGGFPSFIHGIPRTTLEAHLGPVPSRGRFSIYRVADRKLWPSLLFFLPKHTRWPHLIEFCGAMEANAGKNCIVEGDRSGKIVRSDHNVTEQLVSPVRL